jgi:FkbM family methyltransferase
MHHKIFSEFKCAEGFVEAGFTTNFLGVLTRDRLWHGSSTTQFPSFDEEYFEWIDLLEAVTSARGRFSMIELGAGWGRWLVNAVAALRQCNRDLPYELIGVEPEPTHFQYMKMHFMDNGIDPSRHQLIQAAVTDRGREVWFYVGRPDQWYGQAIVPEPDFVLESFPQWIRKVGRLQRIRKVGRLFMRRFVNKGMIGNEQVKKVKAVNLSELLGTLDRVDLIDLDVQGAELIVLKAAAEQLDRKVKRVHIGTHSTEIEAGLRRLFDDLGWKSVHDYPLGSESVTPWGTIKFQDGVQSWINSKLVGAPQ